jgi:hypothetical protein
MVFSVFSKIFKKLQIPQAFYLAIREAFGPGAYIKLSQTSPSVLRPGDIVTFSYPGKFSARRLLVVGTEKAPRGKYMSSRGNYLVCCYELNESYPELVFVFNSFFKKRSINYSAIPKTSQQIFGVTNFKTFNAQKISKAYQIEIAQGDESSFIGDSDGEES